MRQLRGDDGELLRDSVAARAELEQAKVRVLESPERLDLRLELAEAYRARGFPDQAGRWGILAEGWATDLELDRLARLIASSEVPFSGVREFLVLPDEEEVPTALLSLFAGPVREHRARFSAQRSRGNREQDALAIADRALLTFAIAAFVTFLVSLLVVFCFALAGSDAAPSLARFGAFASLLFGALALLAWVCSATIRLLRRVRSPT